jgi:hypothetical protein
MSIFFSLPIEINDFITTYLTKKEQIQFGSTEKLSYYESSPPYTKPMSIQTLRSLCSSSSKHIPKFKRCCDQIFLSIQSKEDYEDCLTDSSLTFIRSLRIFSADFTFRVEPQLGCGMFRCLILLDLSSFDGMIELRNLHKASPNLQTLNLQASGVTDGMIEDLLLLSALTNLNLRMSRGLTDIGLSHLAKIQTLEILDLSCCRRITDGGVRNLLRQIKSPLHTLSLSECHQLSQYCFANINDNPNLIQVLKSLDVSRMPIKRLAPISTLHSLTSLNLTMCGRIVDFESITKLPRLKFLGLRYCSHISDSDTSQFISTLKDLCKLDIEGCYQITYTGIRTIQCVKKTGIFHPNIMIRWIMSFYECFQYSTRNFISFRGFSY